MTVPLSGLAVIVDAPGSDPTPRRGRRKKDQTVYEPNGERLRCEVMRGQMETSRASFIDHWRELGNFILPRRPRFYTTDTDRGDRRTHKIIDGSPTQAAYVLRSGMMSGLTSPARPWFKLTTGDPDLDLRADVKEWLEEVRRRMALAFLRSNLYQALPVVYGDMGVFGTAAMSVEEDDEQIFRFYPYPIGTYAIQCDDKGRIRVFMRTFRWQVWQVVERWGNIKQGVPDFLDPARADSSAISPIVQRLWRSNMRQQWIDICHFVYPNQQFDSSKWESRFKQFKSVYYEFAAPMNLLLEEKGFDEFPILVPRWEVNAEDNYGTNCPGMIALGDIKQLQVVQKRILQAVEKSVNPPVKGPTSLRAAKATTLPGEITYVDEHEGTTKFTSVYDIKFDIDHARQLQQETRERIDKFFFKDLFLMMASMDDARGGRERITATEIMEKKEEKLLMLGPVLEQSNQDLYDPLILRCFNIMKRQRLIPPPPPALAGRSFQAEYISVMAQAQKAVSNANMERFVSFVAQLTQAVESAKDNPETIDNIDIDHIIEDYADAMGIAPNAIRPEDAVKAIRADRKRQLEAQQKAEQAAQLAKTAKDAAGADMSGDSALTRMFGRRTASSLLGKTNEPPVEAGGIPQ